MSDEPADYAQLTRPAAEQRAGAPPVFVLAVPRWTEGAARGLTLRLWECDFEGSPDPRFDLAAPRQPIEPRTLIVELALDLARHAPGKAAGVDPSAPVGWTVTNPRVTAGKGNVVGTTRLRRPGRPGKTTGTSQGADLTLLAGDLRFHLKVPDADGFLDEGVFYEVGWELADATGAHRWARVADTHCELLPAPDVLGAMRGLSTRPRGALVKAQPGKALADPAVPPKELMGRFGDPARRPPVRPADVPRLDAIVQAQVERARAGAEPTADVDGLRFDLFTRPGETRRQAVERLARESATIAAAREDAPPKHPLLLTDIRKAYFVVHDIGVGPDAPRGKDHYGEKPTEHAKRRRSVAGEFVHGFLNHNGTFAVSRDLGDGRGPATVYENLQEGGWVGRYGVAIECVPIVMTPAFRAYERARDAGDARAKRPRGRRQATFEGYGDAEIACEGTKGGAIYRWPHALLDALADLYVFASARAGHLLTVTAHVEMDRNLLLSQTFFEHDKAAVAAFKGARARYRDQARDVHGDPYGLDLQVFYDKITARLNALGGLKLPPGVRYGVHPRRITTAAGETIGQSEGAAHTFPYQSSEAILRLNAAQAALVRRWSGSIRPVYGDGPKGRRVVTGFKGTPFWAE